MHSNRLIMPPPLCGSVAEWLGRYIRTLGRLINNAINRSLVRILASSLSSATLGKLLTHMCGASVTKQYNLVPANGR